MLKISFYCSYTNNLFNALNPLRDLPSVVYCASTMSSVRPRSSMSRRTRLKIVAKIIFQWEGHRSVKEILKKFLRYMYAIEGCTYKTV
jgi:hypothetical protein